VREPDHVAIDADKRRRTVGQLDARHLDHANTAAKKLRHRSSTLIRAPAMMNRRGQMSNRDCQARIAAGQDVPL
jgi:hypothetical protein